LARAAGSSFREANPPELAGRTVTLSAAEWRGLPLCSWTIDQINMALGAYDLGDLWRAASIANMLTAYVPEPAVERIADKKACDDADILRERFEKVGITVGWLSPREFH
jgi:hypothetical protein